MSSKAKGVTYILLLLLMSSCNRGFIYSYLEPKVIEPKVVTLYQRLDGKGYKVNWRIPAGFDKEQVKEELDFCKLKANDYYVQRIQWLKDRLNNMEASTESNKENREYILSNLNDPIYKHDLVGMHVKDCLERKAYVMLDKSELPEDNKQLVDLFYVVQVPDVGL